MTHATPEQASAAVSGASRRTRVACRTRSTRRTDSDAIVCMAVTYRETCISENAKVTFGAVAAQGWAVAVSSLARHVARHARHYPTARADSHSLAVTVLVLGTGGGRARSEAKFELLPRFWVYKY